jgi:hypothetical protein
MAWVSLGDPYIIKRQHSHNIDILPLKLLQVLDVAREMLDGATGGEGARDGEEHDFLRGPFAGGVVGDGDPAGGYVV